MQEYALRGKYALNGKQGLFEGKIAMDANGTFQGEVKDFSSQAPQQTVRGFVRPTETGTLLLFLKTPPDEGLAQLLYALQKEQRGVEGRFTGFWYAIPRCFDVDLERSASRLALSLSLEHLPYRACDEAEVRLEQPQSL